VLEISQYSDELFSTEDNETLALPLHLWKQTNKYLNKQTNKSTQRLWVDFNFQLQSPGGNGSDTEIIATCKLNINHHNNLPVSELVTKNILLSPATCTCIFEHFQFATAIYLLPS